MSARTLADVGIVVPYGASGEIRTTCPQCSPSRRKSHDACLAVNVNEGLWHCWHCRWAGSLQGGTHHTPATPQQRRSTDYDKRAAIRRVWHAAQPIAEDAPVYRYLHRRGIAIAISDFPEHIRCHTALPYRHDDGTFTYHPAMVTRVDDPGGHIASLHRTYITADGQKANVPSVKRLMPCSVYGSTKGGASRLYQAGETLCVTEGIETALAIRLQLGTHYPVWAALSAGGMARLVVPPEVKLVIICADNDAAGVQASQSLTIALCLSNRRVKVLIPDEPGTDWADAMLEDGDYA